MPCGARLEVVEATVLGEGDVRVSDHVDVEIRILPVLPPPALDALIRERAREIGAIESSREGRGADGSYELVITVKT